MTAAQTCTCGPVPWQERKEARTHYAGCPLAEPWQRESGQSGVCNVCTKRIWWVECPTGGWWAHDIHPADDHDAEPSYEH